MSNMSDFITFLVFIIQCITVVTVSTILPGIQGICIEEITVPARVQAGQTVTLACRFDLKGKSLYSLNWWRGSEQFYQFTPNSPEKITVYDTPGITVDKSRSGRNLVVLRNISRASAGKYKCEVLADYPSFEKDSEITQMEVVDVPEQPPKLGLTHVQWSPGDVLLANCSYPGARPQPHLQWYINSELIPSEYSRLVTPKRLDHMPSTMMSEGSDGEISRSSELTLVLKEKHFSSYGRASLTCVATLPELYRRTAEVTLTMPGFRAAAPSQKFYGSGGTSEMGSLLLTAMLLSLIVITL